MSIREVVAKKPAIALVVASVVIAGSIAFAAFNLRGDPAVAEGKAFYSDDDGATWFTDEPDKLPPFDHDGKQAVRANVCSYANGSKQAVAYLERYTPAARNAIAKAMDVAAKDPQHQTSVPFIGDRASMEVKLPGKDSPWVSEVTADGQKAINHPAPDGGIFTPVIP